MTASGRRCRAETTPSSARHRPYVPCFAAASPSSDASSTSAQSADTNSSLAELWMLCAAPRNLRTLAAGICPLMSAMPPTSPAPSLTTEPGTSACHSCTEKGKPPEPLRAASSRHAEAPSSLASTRSHASRLASGLMSDHQLESGCGRTRLFRHESTRTCGRPRHTNQQPANCLDPRRVAVPHLVGVVPREQRLPACSPRGEPPAWGTLAAIAPRRHLAPLLGRQLRCRPRGDVHVLDHHGSKDGCPTRLRLDRRRAHRDATAHRVADQHAALYASGAHGRQHVARQRSGLKLVWIAKRAFAVPAKVVGDRRIAGGGEVGEHARPGLLGRVEPMHQHRRRPLAALHARGEREHRRGGARTRRLRHLHRADDRSRE
mmetsp:Transcript_17829/g.51637  ORF Transcript_17829/g.51637 Transcript_17829/m.51637 type:complete len:375 (-) Transcript_17829:131-1255(-)